MKKEIINSIWNTFQTSFFVFKRDGVIFYVHNLTLIDYIYKIKIDTYLKNKIIKVTSN